MRTKNFSGMALGVMLSVCAGCLPAQARDPVAAPLLGRQTVPFGVPLAPPIYFVNFLFLYFANPPTAALMPAYRAPVPQQVYHCLLDNPDGCPYVEMAPYFRQQAADKSVKRGMDTVWPSYCQTTEKKWLDLAPPVYENADQINEPLGEEKAAKLARALGIVPEMILTKEEYGCVLGVPPRDRAQQILYACFIDFTASKGNKIVVPFSSYGLNLNEQGNVLSLCAPSAPCLEANKVFPLLPEIAERCGFTEKLDRFLRETPVEQFILDGGQCQGGTPDACIAETTCPNGRANSGCASIN
ncbi:MAG TPA: hypothetical protein VJV77_06025 [Casimicrobiaceae bacterium]|nr:hypothetical protein [Casimicrobiaceae bacterium]